MNFHILFCSSRHVTIELDEDAIYETASYEIWVNGRLKGVFHRMIQTIDGLHPDTDYEIMLVRANEASETVTFHTEPEPITLILAHLVMAFMTTQAQFRQLFFVALRMQEF